MTLKIAIPALALVIACTAAIAESDYVEKRDSAKPAAFDLTAAEPRYHNYPTYAPIPKIEVPTYDHEKVYAGEDFIYVTPEIGEPLLIVNEDVDFHANMTQHPAKLFAY